jgi:hypothetical protein
MSKPKRTLLSTWLTHQEGARKLKAPLFMIALQKSAFYLGAAAATAILSSCVKAEGDTTKVLNQLRNELLAAQVEMEADNE